MYENKQIDVRQVESGKILMMMRFKSIVNS